MSLTTAQTTALKADILTNVNTIPVFRPFAGTAINAMPIGEDADFEIALWYNGTAVPDYFVWRDLPMDTVFNSISLANMTPIDSIPVVLDLDIQVWIARALSCQGKQFNLQNLTIGKTTAPMKKTNYRAAMQDCLTNIPAGAGGALLAANWVGVRDAAKQTARWIEKLFATGNGLFATPSDLVFEGTVSTNDVTQSRNLP